jgi:chromosome segregation ATPase
LPQDKVSEFAALTPVELLYSTQRAVAKPYMLEYHDDLKGLRREQKTLQEKEAADKDTISSLETRQQQLRGDVDRIRERAEITQRIKLLELARPFVEYRKLRNNHLDAKNKRQEARAALAQLEQDVEPSLQALKSKQAYSEKVAAAAKERNRGLARQDAIVKAYAQKQPTLGDQIKEIKEERKSEKDKDKNRHLVVEKIERRIEQLENAAKEAPVTFDVAEFNEKIVSFFCVCLAVNLISTARKSSSWTSVGIRAI